MATKRRHAGGRRPQTDEVEAKLSQTTGTTTSSSEAPAFGGMLCCLVLVLLASFPCSFGRWPYSIITEQVEVDGCPRVSCVRFCDGPGQRRTSMDRIKTKEVKVNWSGNDVQANSVIADRNWQDSYSTCGTTTSRWLPRRSSNRTPVMRVMAGR